MSRMNKIIIKMLIGVATLAIYSCESDLYPSENPTIVTEDVTNISNTSAILEITVNGGTSYSEIKGVLYSSNNRNPDKNSQKIELDSYYSSARLNNLTKGTTYYYRSYVRRGDDYIYGSIKSFKTTNIITSARVLTGDGYSNGYYSGKYHFSINTFAWGLDEISEWGNQVSSSTDFSSPAIGAITNLDYLEGTAHLQKWNAGTTGYRYYRAYAKLKSGSSIFGEIKSIHVTY
jgi:hypothetical protein